jgi:predicted metal-dependent peptidase
LFSCPIRFTLALTVDTKGFTMTQLDRISRARTHLLLDNPWFGALAMRLHVAESADTPTMATNGTSLFYCEQWVKAQTDDVLRSVIAHEVLHCALLHPYRTGGREMKQWNVACDYTVNELLSKQGFTLPDGALLDSHYFGMSAEQIYAARSQDHRDNGQPQPEPGPGEFTQPQPGDDDGQEPGPAGTQPQPEPMSATDWQVASEQAAMAARKAGSMDGATDRAMKAARPTETNWREILRRFVEQTVPSDYSWMSPNRRYISNGVYLPGMVKENTPTLTVAVDTSSSIGERELQLFARELTTILHETRPESVDVIYCDTRVAGTESFSPDDPEVILNARGGGGTLFQPVFDHIAEQDNSPACLIYLTDLEGPDATEPDYPVLWVVPESSTLTGPFGETVRLSAWD